MFLNRFESLLDFVKKDLVYGYFLLNYNLYYVMFEMYIDVVNFFIFFCFKYLFEKVEDFFLILVDFFNYF